MSAYQKGLLRRNVCGLDAFLVDVVRSYSRYRIQYSANHSGNTLTMATLATCRACDAPLKLSANYCVVCGAKQHRSRGLQKTFRPLALTFAALTCGAIAAV